MKLRKPSYISKIRLFKQKLSKLIIETDKPIIHSSLWREGRH